MSDFKVGDEVEVLPFKLDDGSEPIHAKWFGQKLKIGAIDHCCIYLDGAEWERGGDGRPYGPFFRAENLKPIPPTPAPAKPRRWKCVSDGGHSKILTVGNVYTDDGKVYEGMRYNLVDTNYNGPVFIAHNSPCRFIEVTDAPPQPEAPKPASPRMWRCINSFGLTHLFTHNRIYEGEPYCVDGVNYLRCITRNGTTDGWHLSRFVEVTEEAPKPATPAEVLTTPDPRWTPAKEGGCAACARQMWVDASERCLSCFEVPLVETELERMGRAEEYCRKHGFDNSGYLPAVYRALVKEAK